MLKITPLNKINVSATGSKKRIDKKSFKALCLLGGVLSLTACSTGSGSVYSSSSSGGCGSAFTQACEHTHSGQTAVIRSRYGAGSSSYESLSFGSYGQNYPAFQSIGYVPQGVTYVQSPQSVVSYVETIPVQSEPAPLPLPAPAPVIFSEPQPVIEALPPVSSWEATPSWDSVDDISCPPGTIQGYDGGPCVQVEIGRK